MKFILGLIAALAVAAPGVCQADDVLHAMSLGHIEIKLVSRGVSETNSLLKILLSTTAHFLDASFIEVDKVSFRKVACSIHTYQLGAVENDDSVSALTLYEANVTITGHAYFYGDTVISQRDLINLSVDAFEADNSLFLRSLLSSSNLFLANLEHAVVKVNGDKVVEKKNNNDGDLSTRFALPFPVWMVAVIAGGTAFCLVVSIALGCFCCCNGNKKQSPNNNMRVSSSLGINTKPTGTSYLEEDVDDDKTPSPTRSITSQDSSVFTYNPKSSRTVGSYFSTSNGSYEGDWYQSGMTAPSKDLSLIEEGSEVSSEQSTPRQLRQTLDHQNFKSLLQKPGSFEEEEDGESHSLTQNALREIEWNAEQNGNGADRAPSRWDLAASKNEPRSFQSEGFDVYGDAFGFMSPQKTTTVTEAVDFASTDLETQMENLYGEGF